MENGEIHFILKEKKGKKEAGSILSQLLKNKD